MKRKKGGRKIREYAHFLEVCALARERGAHVLVLRQHRVQLLFQCAVLLFQTSQLHHEGCLGGALHGLHRRVLCIPANDGIPAALRGEYFSFSFRNQEEVSPVSIMLFLSLLPVWGQGRQAVPARLSCLACAVSPSAQAAGALPTAGGPLQEAPVSAVLQAVDLRPEGHA